MRIGKLSWLCAAAAVLGLTIPSLFAQEKEVPKRAKRPTFTKKQVETTYFKDIFAQGFQGERPATLAATAANPDSTNGGNGDSPMTGGTGGGGFAWSNLIGPDVLENQVKNLKKATDANVTTPVKFTSGGYAVAREDFTELAMLFAIINEYDGEVRWKQDAGSIRDAFARAAANTKTASPQAYEEAKKRKQDLEDIVGGQSFSGTKTTEPLNIWPAICDRQPLMVKFDQIYNDRLKKITGSEAEFNANIDLVRHEASLLAAMSEVLIKEGMEDASESDYVKLAVACRDQAKAIIEATKSKDYAKAAAAYGDLNQTCQLCHADWQ